MIIHKALVRVKLEIKARMTLCNGARGEMAQAEILGKIPQMQHKELLEQGGFSIDLSILT